MWRVDFGFSRRQHSLAQFGYADDELLEWRRPFDELAQENGIDFPAFERFVARRYRGVIPDEELAKKVKYFWEQFDKNHNGFIDFGEFIVAGLLFDVTWTKEKIRKEGVEETFARYAEHGFIAEPQLFQLMCDFRFSVATATDVRKLMHTADIDRDGLVSLSDFVQWAESADTGLEERRPRRRAVRLPPPEPEG